MTKIKSIPKEWEELVNEDQKKAIEHIDGPLSILAGAGSGKTRVLTYRYAHLVMSHSIDFENILAITFTNKAADEMKKRISNLLNLEISPKWISTFHSLCLKILRRNSHLIGFENNFTIYDESDSVKVVRNCIREMDLDSKTFPPKRYKAQISKLKNDRVLPSEAIENATSFNDIKVAEVYTSYQKKLIQANAMDFDDLLIKTVELLETNDQALLNWSNKFKYIMVDEYQDTNMVQYKLIELLSSKHKNLCVVGDSDQSIYAFRGANIRNIQEFEKHYSNAEIITLERNYRSSQKILDIANAVISNNPRKQEKKLWTKNDIGLDVDLVSFNTGEDEAKWVADEISKILDNDSSEEVAIFYRANRQSRLFEESLSDNNIQFKILNSVAFYERKEIKDILAYLSFLVNPDDVISFERILNVPRRGIGDSTLKKLRDIATNKNLPVSNVIENIDDISSLSERIQKQLNIFNELIRELRTFAMEGPSKSIEKIIELTGYKSQLQKEETQEALNRIENLDELRSGAINFENRYDEEVEDPFTKLRDYLDSISLYTNTDDIEKGDNVLLMTLHNAKGLEFPTVFITGLEEGTFPGSLAETEFDFEEERRLCYVGMTRAEKRLVLSYATTRNLWGGVNYNLPSRFLDESKPFFNELEKGFKENSSISNVKEYSIGKVVIHDKYGKGFIVETSGNEITIDFGEEWGIKHLDAEWAPIRFE